MSGLQGGNILHGAMMGALVAGQGQVLSRYGGRMRTGARLAVVAVVGGTVAELGGGKFANGAMTAAFAFLFNESMHGFNNQKVVEYNKELVRKRLHRQGFLTLQDAKTWYQIGNGEEIVMDASKLVLDDCLTTNNFVENTITKVDTFKGPIEQALVYGTISVKYIGHNLFFVLPDVYDFDMHRMNGLREIIRNVATVLGEMYNGNGTAFKIRFENVYHFKGN